jgi:hypothetical protein
MLAHLNTPSKFKSHLRNPLILDGFWKKAFVEANIMTDNFVESRLFVACLFYRMVFAFTTTYAISASHH